MKTYLYLLLFVALYVPLSAQNQKYHRVTVYTGSEGLHQMAAKGIAVDHGALKKNYSFTSEFSDGELAQIQELGLKYEVLISDLENYYSNQNNGIEKSMMLGSPCSDCGDFTDPSNFALGSMGGFFTYQELLDNLDSMAAKYPSLITVRAPVSSDTTFEGRPLYYVKISDNPSSAETEPQVLYTSLHHAREAASLSQLIYYMWYLLENYGTNAEVTYLVNNLEIYFIPCVNPDGYIYNEITNPAGGGMWRKNRVDNEDGTFGVDLNRNYGYNWGFDNTGSSATSSAETFRGPFPFSEKETQMVRDFCNAHSFKMAINNHTYSNLLIYPWGYNSQPSPDSLAFTAFAERLTHCSEFAPGTAIETVGYNANGNSDDWMYGEQSSKPKIYSMTPEAGSVDDGFWPAQNRIIDICKTTMDQNLFMCRLAAVYAEVKNRDEVFMLNTSAFVNYNIQRLGLEPGTYTVSLVPLSASIQSVGSAKVYSSLALLQELNDSISITLNPSVNLGDVVKYLINIDNGFYTVTDTITRVYGAPVQAFSSNCNTTTGWMPGGWAVSSTQFVSSSGSITDSPAGNYSPNLNKSITTSTFINLTDALAANLSYYANWDVEQGWDYVEVQASVNGTVFIPLCGKYTNLGNPYQDDQQPLYDGTQSTWVKESIDLSSYLGQNIKLRFKLVSDGGVEGDGFYFDDVLVEKIANPAGIGDSPAGNYVLLQSIPNPCSDYTEITYTLKDHSQPVDLLIVNQLGQLVKKQNLDVQKKSVLVNIQDLEQGVYYYHLSSRSGESVVKRLVVVK
jgi:carboxypeptidase T